jgi:hypothetical protein
MKSRLIRAQKSKNYNPKYTNVYKFTNNTNGNKTQKSPPKEDPPLEKKFKSASLRQMRLPAGRQACPPPDGTLLRRKNFKKDFTFSYFVF